MAKITNPYYEELAYIQSNGSQYINTGLTTSNKRKIEIGLAASSTSRYNIYGSGGGSAASDTTYSIRFGSSSYPKFTFLSRSNSPGTVITDVDVDTNKHDIVLDIANSIGTIDGTHYSLYENTGTSSYAEYIFAYSRLGVVDNNYSFVGKIYYVRYYEDGTLLRDFVPARRKSDNVVGLLDIANNDFYTNSGSGTFSYGLLADVTVDPVNSGTITGTGEYTVGSNVTLTAIPNSGYTFEKWLNKDYVLLTAIGSTGTQWINTGINCTSSITFEIGFAFTDISGTQTIMGSTTDGRESNLGINNNYFRGAWAQGVWNTNIAIADTNWHTYKLENGKLYFDNIEFGTPGNGYSNIPIHLFKTNYSNSQYWFNAKAKLSYAKFYNNGTLIRNFVPVLYYSVGFGLLDLVEMKFYPNSGTGNFLAYEESTTTQYPSMTDNPLTVSNIANSLILTAQFKKTANCRYKVNGTWKNAMMYIKQNGTWKPGTPKIKVNGNWKEGG